MRYGIHSTEHASIADTWTAIHHTLDRALAENDIVIITGGLGPTKDDITKKALADFFGLEMYFDQDLYDRIAAAFLLRNIPLKDSHRQQCYMPQGIRILANGVGTAPGMLFERDGKYVISLPGVPFEMKNILQGDGHQFFSSLNSSFPYFQRTIMTAGQGETTIADQIDDILDAMPPNFKIAYLPSYGSVRLRVSSTEAAGPDVMQQGQAIVDQLVERLGTLVFGYDDEPLAQAVGRLIADRGWMLALAESCTGGYMSHMITSIAGSSAYYSGGVVAYSNAVKAEMLSVDPKIIADHGAVSEATVRAMLEGVLNQLNSDIGISISGIAGPGGGTPDKPVGMIWVAYGQADDVRTKQLFINRNRDINIKYASHVALNLLREYIIETGGMTPS
ncbi:UNVERIFIED_CONTAM: hypothetical protein GTU68_037302 [Idotea baltica]|nr:hypothetical protein [Idotea baltica]